MCSEFGRRDDDRLLGHGVSACELGGARRRGGRFRWMLRGSWFSGLCGLSWLLLRSGTKPSRIVYPCQQAAMGAATAAFGVAVVGAVVGFRRRLAAVVRGLNGRAGVFVLAALAVGVGTVASINGSSGVVMVDAPAGYHPKVYLVNDARGIVPGRYGGVDDLVTLMGLNGFKWYRSPQPGLTSGPDGMIDVDDVVLIKINAQWAQRGGTNTDVLRGVIRRIVEHPDGFNGEIIVADNGQGLGNFDRSDHNAENHHQSPQDVVNDFVAGGWAVSTQTWDDIAATSVSEFAAADMTSGYVLAPAVDPQTQIRVSYPKFRSAFGTYISYKHGVWSPGSQTYDPDRLVVINMPVFKTHFIYGITGAVKNHMGVVTQQLGTGSHQSVGLGGLGSMLADVRVPDVTILDCIWILARPGSGPWAPYAEATRRDQLVASTDPVALDAWATKFIMIPQIVANGYSFGSYHDTQDPDNADGVFRRYLDLSKNEMLLAGMETTSDYHAVDLHVWVGDSDRDGDVDLGDLAGFLADCPTGPGGGVISGCEAWDTDDDGDVDLSDFAALQAGFTGPF